MLPPARTPLKATQPMSQSVRSSNSKIGKGSTLAGMKMQLALPDSLNATPNIAHENKEDVIGSIDQYLQHRRKKSMYDME